MKTRNARPERFLMRLSVDESAQLNRVTAKLGCKDASKALRRLMEMYEENELAVDAVLVGLRKYDEEKVK